jgi:septal ring factor EnvC (AmiA/AmiB activator)
LATLLAIGPARAETDPAETARRAAALLEEAGGALMAADSARDRVEALTQTVRAYEEGLLALREGMRQAALREQTIMLVFEAERDRLARLLGVLQAIEGSPAPVLSMHPQGALGAARSGMIISDITPAVLREAETLRAQLEELTLLRALQGDAINRLSSALDEVQTARAALSQAIADRVTLPQRFVQNETAMRRLLESVDSLDSFAEVLAADPAPDISDLPGFGDARGDLPLPVLGAVLRRFNETDAAGVTRPGLVLAAQPSALVTAPWPASVRYAGPLLDYGNVIILEPDGLYLLVLAGLGDLYVEAGQIVSSGAALGLMPGTPADADSLVRPEGPGSGVGMTETLYIEARENGRPVDPETWFAQTRQRE